MQPLEARWKIESRRSLLGSGLTLALTAALALVLRMPMAPLAAIILMSIGPTIHGQSRARRDRSVQLRVDAEGIEDRRSGLGRIAWNRVRELRDYGMRFYIVVNDDAELPDRPPASMLKRPLGDISTAGYWVRFDGFDVGRDAIRAAAHEAHEAFGRQRPEPEATPDVNPPRLPLFDASDSR